MEEIFKKEKLYITLLAMIQVAHILDFVIMMPLGPTLMRVLNIGPTQFGVLVSSYTIGASVIGFFGALYVDNFDRKKVLITLFSLFIVGTALCGMATNYKFLLFARILTGCFGGITNACVFALVADLIPPERRGRATGVVMSSFSMASILGVPLGLFIANLWGWNSTFYMIVALSLVAVIMAFKLLPPVPAKSTLKPFKETVGKVKDILKEKNYLICFALTSFLSLGSFMIIPFLSPYMVKNVGLTEQQLPLIYLFGGAFTILSARFIGKQCDKKGAFVVFKIVFFLSWFPIIAITNLPPVPVYAVLIVSTFFMMLVSGRFIPAMTMLSLAVRPEQRGSFMALENALRLLMSGMASLVAGQMIQEGSNGRLQGYALVGWCSIGFGLLAFYFGIKLKKKFNLR